MKIKEKGHTLIVKPNEGSLQDFIVKLQGQYPSLKNHNWILDLTQIGDLTSEDWGLLEPLRSLQSAAKKSLVVVVAAADYNDFDQELVVVPSLQEASDIIEMDEIERDLGF